MAPGAALRAATAGEAAGAADRPRVGDASSHNGLWTDELAALCSDPRGRASRLCADGAAIEHAFVWPGGDERVTCDPTPGRGVAQRIDAAFSLCAGTLGPQQRVQAKLVGGWIGDAARFGAWVGARVRNGRTARKLYLEISEDAPWRAWAPSAALATPDVPSRLLVPVMAGFDGISGTVEIYWRAPAIHPGVLRAVLHRMDLADATGALLAAVARLTGRAVRDGLPGRDHGLSVAFGADGAERALTWYAHAEQLLGPPTQARDALLQVGTAVGWPMDRYAAASSPDPAGEVPCHGFVGVGIGAEGAIATSITCSHRAQATP